MMKTATVSLATGETFFDLVRRLSPGFDVGNSRYAKRALIVSDTVRLHAARVTIVRSVSVEQVRGDRGRLHLDIAVTAPVATEKALLAWEKRRARRVLAELATVNRVKSGPELAA